MNYGAFMLLGGIFTNVLLGLATSSAHAQEGTSAGAPENDRSGLEEIVVTAQRRDERNVDVPISVTALSTQQLASANAQGLGDIAELTPALRFDAQDGFVQPSIRGIGTGVVNAGGGSNVGIYIDGFYSPNPVSADFQLLNVTSVQVLKGPQGTLFGRNTTGGAILVTTPDPTTDSQAEVRASYGSNAAQSYQAYGTTGLGENVAVDVSGVFSKGDGFLTNIMDGDDTVGAYENWTVRTGLKIELSDALSVLVRYTRSRQDDPQHMIGNSNTDRTIDPTTGLPWDVQTLTVPGFYTTDPDEIAADLPTYLTSDSHVAQMRIDADLGFADLTSYSQWRKEDFDQSVNFDHTGLPNFQLGLPTFDRTITQEFLLNSKGASRLQWTAGLFYLENEETYETYVDTFVRTRGRIRLQGSSATTESIAGYFDTTYELTPKFFITAGARYARDRVKDAYFNQAVTIAEIPIPGLENDKVTPRVVIRYKPTDQSSIYASYTAGYKAAIRDVGGSCQTPPAFQCTDVKPEEVDAFEVGYKFDSRNLSAALSTFYYDYKNLQISEFLFVAGLPRAAIVNAAASEIYGLEGQIRYELTDSVQISAGAAWTHARYKKFGTTINGTVVGAPIYAGCPDDLSLLPPQYRTPCTPAANRVYVNTDTVLSDVHMQRTPDFSANFGPRFTTGETATGEYSLAANYYYTSEFYLSPSGTQFLQPSYSTLGVRAEWRDPSEKYMVALYGDNVTDKRYRTQAQYASFGIAAMWSAPAMWGVELGAKF
jgi:iron complex outermembrane receptor protein